MSKLARAIGFIAGGAAQGYGQGVVEQAKLNWAKMLQDESDARADAREERRMTYDADQKGLDRKQRADEFTQETDIKREDIAARRDETRASREETQAWREQQREDTLQYRRDQLNLRLREIEGREGARGFSNEQLNIIGEAQKAVGLTDFATQEEIAEAAPEIVKRLTGVDKKLADRYAAIYGVEAEVEDDITSADGAPGLGGNESAQPKGDADDTRPPKPSEYPDARWSDRAKAWVVRKDGGWFAVE